MIDTSTNPDKQTALFMQIGAGVASFFMWGLGFIVPLIMYFVNKEKADKAWLVEEAKESLNFHLTITMVWVAIGLLSFVGIGFFLLIPAMFVLPIGGLVFAIIAGMKNNEGQSYRFPVAVRLIK